LSATKNENQLFQVPGVQQSPLEVIVMKDGKELRIGQDVALKMQGGKIDLSVINPKREKSGTYTVILRNAQGEAKTDIQVNIQGMSQLVLMGRLHLRFGCAVWMCVSLSHAFSMSFWIFRH
jgi:hypothetical protein